MSDSDPVSAPVRWEKRKRQDSDTGSENSFMLSEGHKETAVKITAKLQHVDSDSEEDNELQPAKKRQTFLHDKQDSSNSQFKPGSIKAEPGKKVNDVFINKHKENKNTVGKKVEHSGYDKSDISDDEKEEDSTKPLGMNYMPERENLQDENCGSADSGDPVNSIGDDMKGKSRMKWETRESENVSEDENSIKSSALKQSVQILCKKYIEVRKSPQNKSKPKQQLTSSDTDNEKSPNILKYALESDQDFKSSNQCESLKMQKKIVTAVENRKGKNSDSDCDGEKSLKVASVKTAKHEDSSDASSRESSNDKQQNTKSKAKDGREKTSNSHSEEEKALNTTVTKSADQSGISHDSGKEGKTEKQEMPRTKKRARIEIDSDSDEVEGKLLKTVPKTAAKKDFSCGPDREGQRKKQQRAKTTGTSGSQRDSEEKMSRKDVLKKTAEEGSSSGNSDREDNERKPQKQRVKVKARQRKDSYSESNSEEEKPLKTLSKKITEEEEEEEDGSSDCERKGGKRKQQNQKVKVRARRRNVSDSESDSGEEKPLKTLSKR
ncbi:hypothetical protein B7P43_G01372, partial [Cryptotermes secundus]